MIEMRWGSYDAVPLPEYISRLRDWFNGAVDIPLTQREAWLERNVRNPAERIAVAALLFAYDGDGAIELSAAPKVSVTVDTPLS